MMDIVLVAFLQLHKAYQTLSTSTSSTTDFVASKMDFATDSMPKIMQSIMYLRQSKIAAAKHNLV